MKKCVGFVLLIFLGGLLFAADQPKFEPLPVPLSNNAVASVKSRGSLLLYSMMGMGPKKTWDATSNSAFMLDSESDTGKWAEVRPVPGTIGRLAATAVGAREHVFLFGGYVVDAQGGETTVHDVNAYEPLTDRWFRAEDVPVAVDDSVAGLYRDRYIYLVSGWSNTDAVRDVQVYDAEKNTWSKATPIPGTPVFGHAGAVVGDTIVYVGGAYKNPALVQARSTNTIAQKFSGPNCPAILGPRNIASLRVVQKKTRKYTFPAEPTIPITTTVSGTTENLLNLLP
jgi:N-acetylneuraminic acid mutarotase